MRSWLFPLLLIASPARADEFWKHWGDGRAELSGYALTQPRYGQNREGTAVLVFVTEDFSDSARVKADPGKHPPSDVYPVMKLNFVRDFQTGIYDYNVMTSTFLRADSLALVKISFSMQEWCGHVYQQLNAREGKLSGDAHSYFDGEADRALALPLPAGAIVEEQIPILIRGLRGEWLKPGESRVIQYLPSALRARLEHRPQAWGEATVKRAGNVFTVEEKDGPTVSWTVEAAPPKKILGWKSSTGEEARLVGSARLPYWE